MRKITSLFTMLLLFAGAVSTNAQTLEGKWISDIGDQVKTLEGITDGYYLMKNKGRQTYAVEEEGKLFIKPLDLTAFTYNKDANLAYVVKVAKVSENYTFQFKSGNYMQPVEKSVQMTTNATAANFSLTLASEGNFVIWNNPIKDQEKDIRVNGNGDQGGFTIVGWDDSGDNSQYQFFPITVREGAPTASDLAEFKKPLLAKVAEWEKDVDDKLLYPNAEKVAAMKNMINEVTLSSETWEAWETITNKLNKEITLGVVTNLPTGLYTMNTKGRNSTDGHRLTANAGHLVKGVVDNAENALATRSIWKITNSEDGTCTIQNYLTEEYIQDLPYNGKVAMGQTATALTIYPNDGGRGYGTAAFGIGNSKLHLSNWADATLLAWGTDPASTYTIAAVEEADLEAAVAAEKTLAETELEALKTSINNGITSATPLANILSVSDVISWPEAPTTATTLKDYIDINSNCNSVVYETASNYVYRIIAAEANSEANRGKVFAAGADGNPVYVTPENTDSNIEYLWKMVPAGNGFKLVHLNTNFAIAAMEAGSDKKTPFVAIENGENFEIEVSDAATSVIDIKSPNGGSTDATYHYIHLQGGYLNCWKGDGSKLTIQKVEDIDIALTDAAGSAWASAYLPFGVKNEDTEAADLLVGTISENTVKAVTRHNVAAKNGFVIKAAAGTEKVTLKIDNTATATSEIGGSTVATTVNDANRTSIYVFGKANDADVVGFYNLAAAGTVAANKAFIETAAGVKGFVLSDGTATAIENVETNTNGNAAIYDLSGRRVNKAVKGIFIINGKKVIR